MIPLNIIACRKCYNFIQVIDLNISSAQQVTHTVDWNALFDPDLHLVILSSLHLCYLEEKRRNYFKNMIVSHENIWRKAQDGKKKKKMLLLQ